MTRHVRRWWALLLLGLAGVAKAEADNPRPVLPWAGLGVLFSGLTVQHWVAIIGLLASLAFGCINTWLNYRHKRESLQIMRQQAGRK